MKLNLHYETVTPLLKEVLDDIMQESLFDPFLLVGGTSLSLRFGHRMSIDIDLFTNALYGSLDFSLLEEFLKNNFDYYYCTDNTGLVSFGRSYYVGESEKNHIKIDLFYQDEIIDSGDVIDNIRIASIADVIAMKVDVVARGGRKKDFWDLHELLNYYSLSEMLEFHKERFEYTHDRNQIINSFSSFDDAEHDIDPICLKGKVWELIKLSFMRELEKNFYI